MKFSLHSPTEWAFVAAVVCLLMSLARGQEESPITRLFDTGVASVEPLTEASVAKRAGWQAVPEDNLTRRFSGDAVLLNDKLVIVLRKQGHGPEVYAQTAGGLKRRATLDRVGRSSSRAAPFEGFKILENSSSSVMINACFTKAGNGTISFRLTTGEALLEIRPDEWNDSMLIHSQARYLIVPDYFGDDMVYEPKNFRGLLPTENFCLHLIDGGDAIMMAVWASADQDVSVSENSGVKAGEMCSTQVSCRKGKSIWLAFLESPGIWRAAKEPVQNKSPFPAKWRCSLVRTNGVADSWDPEKGPAPQQSAGAHQGPCLVYPIDRSLTTPLTATCPTDVMRNTLGVGPCQYILALECMSTQGNPTPASVMDWVEKQFEQKKQRKAAEDIKERLAQMTAHVAEARARIQLYGEFSSKARRALAKGDSSRLGSILEDLDRFVSAGLGPAAGPEQAQQLAAKVTELIGKEQETAACREIGEQLRRIGEIQDSTLARCRMAARRLRQELRSGQSGKQDSATADQVKVLVEQMLAPKPVVK